MNPLIIYVNCFQGHKLIEKYEWHFVAFSVDTVKGRTFIQVDDEFGLLSPSEEEFYVISRTLHAEIDFVRGDNKTFQNEVPVVQELIGKSDIFAPVFTVASGPTKDFNGQISCFQLFDEALTPAEVNFQKVIQHDSSSINLPSLG